MHSHAQRCFATRSRLLCHATPFVYAASDMIVLRDGGASFALC